MDDDFEIEVTNLDTGATTRHPLDPQAPSEPAYEHEHDRDDDEGPTLEPSGRGHRQRLRAAIVSGVVVLAVVLVIITNPAAHSSLYTVFGFPTPAPSPTPLPGSNIVYLEHGAPWGSVTLDGKRVEHVDLGTVISWIKLPRGRHTLTVTQSPFPKLRCAISMPARKSDTCPLFSPLGSQGQQFGNGPSFRSGARFVDVGARFSLLPHDAQDALIAAINTALSPSTTPVTLQPGDHYLHDDGTMAVAQTTLQAKFIPTLLLPASGITSDSQSCISFCDISGTNLGGSATWDILVSLLGSWHVATREGQAFAEHAPMYVSDPLYQYSSPSMQVTIDLLWTGVWQVSTQNGYNGEWSPACQTADSMMNAHLSHSQVSILGMSEQSGSAPEQGCVISVSLNDPRANAPAYMLYRFGALLAANDVAHRSFPALPLASANERAVTRQLLALPFNP